MSTIDIYINNWYFYFINYWSKNQQSVPLKCNIAAVSIALWTQTMKRNSKHMRWMRKSLPHCVTPQSYLWIWGHFKARSLHQTRNASMRGKENWYEESESVAFGEGPHQKKCGIKCKTTSRRPVQTLWPVPKEKISCQGSNSTLHFVFTENIFLLIAFL